MIGLYIFDMDNTLIENDCDVSWKEFLVAEKIAPPQALEEADRFFDEYNNGTLDPEEFLKFQYREFVGRSAAEMRVLCREHFEKRVRPTVRPKAEKYVRDLLGRGEKCAIVTSTNQYVAEPLAEYLGVTELRGTPLELAGGRFTGRTAGYCGGEGKVAVLDELCEKYRVPRRDVAAFGDSINDLPLLRSCGMACAVSPSPALKAAAEQNCWTILDWRT